MSIDLQAGSDTGISSTDDITRALSLAFDVDFNEDVSGVTAADLSLSGTAIGCSVGSLTGGPTVYDLTVTGCNAGTVTVTFAANGASDTAGNNGPAAATDSATVTIDRTAPVATIDLQDASDTGTSDSDNITKALSLTFDVTFDEDVFTLAASDFSNAGTATGCTFGAPMGSGDTYTVTVSTCSEGTVILRLAAAGVTDTAGNDNVQTDSATVTIDRTAPVVSAPDLDSASDTGVSAADNVTNDDNPDFSGSAEANAFVELLRDGSVVASESAIGSAWSLTDIGPVADGTTHLHHSGHRRRRQHERRVRRPVGRHRHRGPGRHHRSAGRFRHRHLGQRQHHQGAQPDLRCHLRRGRLHPGRQRLQQRRHRHRLHLRRSDAARVTPTP